MTTNKAYTDISQSKKLAEILPIESADMEYLAIKENGALVGTIPFVKDDSEVEDSAYSHIYDRIACWSLAALISVLPENITSFDGITFKLNIKKNIIEYSNPSLYLNFVYKSVKSDNLIDACVAMVENLNELKLL